MSGWKQQNLKNTFIKALRVHNVNFANEEILSMHQSYQILINYTTVFAKLLIAFLKWSQIFFYARLNQGPFLTGAQIVQACIPWCVIINKCSSCTVLLFSVDSIRWVLNSLSRIKYSPYNIPLRFMLLLFVELIK